MYLKFFTTDFERRHKDDMEIFYEFFRPDQYENWMVCEFDMYRPTEYYREGDLVWNPYDLLDGRLVFWVFV